MNFNGCKFAQCIFGVGRIRPYLTVFDRTLNYLTAFEGAGNKKSNRVGLQPKYLVMETKTAYWMRYHTPEGFKHVAVVANSLEEAFKKLIDAGINNEDIVYRNRDIEVLI